MLEVSLESLWSCDTQKTSPCLSPCRPSSQKPLTSVLPRLLLHLTLLGCLATVLIVCLTAGQWPQHVMVPHLVTFSPLLHTRDDVTRPQEAPLTLQCRDVLADMLDGEWHRLSDIHEQAMQDLKLFLHTSRSQHSLPYGLQRQDGRCGNVSFDELEGRMNNLHWFRALCDPDGDTPCCYENSCVAKAVAECRCDSCYDMRQSIDAEFSEWKPRRPDCHVTRVQSPEAACHVLKNMTVYFIGDSFVRHLYISLLDLLRLHTSYGPIKRFTPPGIIITQGCNHTANKQYPYLQMCAKHIDRDVRECGGDVRLKFMEHIRAEHTNLTLKAVREIQGKENSFLFIGIGIHDDFNTTKIIKELVEPLLSLLKTSSSWPRVVWSAMHAPGLLKTPRVPSQNRQSILRYNRDLRQLLGVWGVPVFDTFNLTDGTTSFDGAHYGKGVNDVKAQVFLNYVLEQRGGAIR